MTQKIPITIGIIGHKDAIITAEHVALITGLFDDLQSKFPNSPIILFSQLAEGADTAIADLFLDVKEKTKRDYSLIAPLPFEQERFRSLIPEKGKEHFDDLLAKAARHFVLANETGLDDDGLYRQGGKFVADSSIILIALWEGTQNGLTGGTGDIVKYKKEGYFEDIVEETIFDLKGSLIELFCKRAGKSQKVIILPADPLLATLLGDISLNKSLEKIEQLNKAIVTVYPNVIKQSGDYLYPDDNTLDDTASTLKKYYSITDSLAIDNQTWYNHALGSLFILGMCIIAIFEWYKHLYTTSVCLITTLAFIILALAVFRLSKYRKYHLKFLENRVLAESLRIQFFWNLGNVKKSVANYILRIHKTEFNWIKHILLAIGGITYGSGNVPLANELISKYWLNDQYKYFSKKLPQLEKKEKEFLLLSKVSFYIALVCMVSLFFIPEECGEVHLLHPIIVAIGIFLGGFALSRAFAEKKGYQQIHNQYSLMRDIYKATIDKIAEIEKGTDPDDKKSERIKTLYFLAGKEALIENGNWYLIFKEKEPELEGIGG